MTYYNNEFEKASHYERVYFRNLNRLYNIFPTDKWDIHSTNDFGHDCYDFIVVSKTTYKNYIIEIKIRDTAYDTYVYEYKKHKKLMKIKSNDPKNTVVVYINSTPKGTYIWDVEKIIPHYQKEQREMNKMTKVDKQLKVNKRVYMLKPEDAIKHYEYHWDEKQFIKEREDKILREEINKKMVKDKVMTLTKLLMQDINE